MISLHLGMKCEVLLYLDSSHYGVVDDMYFSFKTN
jgi:hypothetical protein